MFNRFFYNPFYLPTWNTKPPTLYAIMNSIVNFGKEDKTKIKDLVNESRKKLFDFSYPLSSNINKEDFEKMILNKFMKRRIGFETVTDFRIHLNVKLNEIMPLYNKMFDALEGWDIFDGEKIVKTGTDNRVIDNTTNNTLENNSNTSNNEIKERGYSQTPQSYLENVKDYSYLTEYSFDKNNNTIEDTSNSNGSSISNTKDNNNYNETIKRTVGDKIAIYKEFQENLKNIYTMIFDDLDCLFYQLV